ncbi:hypothetical protein ABT095_34555 [Kitasatospora sp. NPDC002227]|uniref:phage distal tail protein n=1 Tax=Kitasatospora sp. NPDC002227 TaxID=3154773 RepID=UPI00331D4624
MSIDLRDWQFDLGGIAMGTGTDVLLEDIQGIGLPPLRTDAVEIPGEDGLFTGQDLYGARVLRLIGGIRVPGDPGAVLDRLAQLEVTSSAAWITQRPGALAVLRARRPGRAARRLYGRVRLVDAVSVSRAVHGWLPFEIEFSATDPWWAADDTSGVTLSLDVSTTREGVTAPLVAPLTTGVANPDTRPGWLLHGGDRPSWPSVRIAGPVTNPRLWVVETGQALELQLSLGAGEFVQIETRPGTRTVLRNGTGNAAGQLTSSSRLDRLRVPPGRSELRWTATDYTNTARLQMSWRDSYTSL